ncbi:MAG: TrmB family transcriptional regulator [Candidatus Lokiarchaeota archaeon]|nr:TrmB family transcriptional regulator [Candidatus Lokiarchaeota archaeon]
MTDYETKAFVALTINGISSAKEISDKTNIPYSRIYDILLNLESQGWVKVHQGRPMMYQAERPKSVAKIAKKQLEEKYKRIESALIDKLEPRYGNEKEIDTTPIFMLKGDISLKIANLLNGAKNKIQIFFNKPDEGFIEEFFDHLLEANTRKVEIQVSIPRDFNPSTDTKKIWRKMLTISKIQTNSRVMFDGIIVDDSDLLVFLSSFFKLNVREENMVFWITEVNLVRYAMTYFKTLWSLGEKFSLVAHRS